MNLLNNGGFEGPWWHPVSPADGSPIGEFQIPGGFDFIWTQHEDTDTPGTWHAIHGSTEAAGPALANPYDQAAYSRFLRPEVRVMLREQVPEWEREQFGLVGEHILKAFHGSGSIWFTLGQTVYDLPGGVYDLTIRVYPDSYQWNEELERKEFGDDPNTSLVRFAPDGEFQSFNPPAGTPAENRLQTIVYRFKHAGGDYDVHVEFMLPFAMGNNGIFCDQWTLEAVSDELPPTPTGKSMLGTHSMVAANEHSNVLDLLRCWISKGGYPPVIKATSVDFGWLPEARRICPKSTVIGRVISDIEGCQGVEREDTDLAWMANDLMKLILDQPADVLASVDYWEPMNEPDPPGDVGYSQLGKLAIECMGIADRYGIKLAILSLNCGTPEWSEMQTLANTGVFEIAKNGGHILALHEGVFENQPIDHWWPDPIPDAPQVAGAGALCFRYRYLYSILRERGEIVPLVISEFRMNGASYPLGIEELVERFKWYDERARTDWYVLGVCPFTIGATGSQWFPSHDYGLAYPSLIDYAVSVENGKDTDEPECDCFGLPREQYERTVLLLPPDGDSRTLSRIVLAFFDAFGFTVTRSADDAGVGALDEKNVIAISPLGWPGDLREFYEQYYPGTNYIPVKYDNLYQLDGRVLAGILKARGLRLRFPLNRSRYVTSEFGVYRTPADSSPYYHNGTDYRGGHNDRILAAHDGVVVYAGYDQSEPWFGHQIKTRASLPDGVEIQIRYAHLPASGGIFVSPGDVVSAGQQIGIPDNTGNSTGSHLHIDVKCLGYYADPEMLVVQEQTPTPNVKVAIGMHDDGGASWMNSNGLTGYALCHRQIRENVEPVDFSSMDRLGIKVIMRWGYGYADGSGTVPPSNIADSWAVTCAESIILSRGVYCNTMFNEWNNVGEWPGGYPKPTEIVSPGHVLYLYNKVVGLLPENIKIAPGAIDPYNVVAGEFGEPADPMYWFEHIMAGAVRADAIMIHAKTQTSDPSECSSNELFSNPPLQERFLHLRAYRNVLSWVPERWRHLPVFISELNPQRKYDGSLGWEDEPAWVNAAMEELRAFNEIAEQPITGVMFYRYDVTGGDQKEFGVSAKPNVLAEIKRQFE